MNELPDPRLPVILLAVVQLADAALCLRPAKFVQQCLEDVRFPRRWWWTLPPLKTLAAAGLLTGLWIKHVAAMTTIALVAYFLAAIAAHVRANDFGRNLFVNASGMVVLCVGTLLLSFAPN